MWISYYLCVAYLILSSVLISDVLRDGTVLERRAATTSSADVFAVTLFVSAATIRIAGHVVFHAGDGQLPGRRFFFAHVALVVQTGANRSGYGP